MLKLTVLLSLSGLLLGFIGGYAVNANQSGTSSPDSQMSTCTVDAEDLQGIMTDIAAMRDAPAEHAKRMRRIIREELASIASGAPAALQAQPITENQSEHGSVKSLESPPLSEEQLAHIDQAEMLIESAIKAGEWNAADQEQLDEWLPSIPTDEAVDLHRALARAINKGEITPSISML